MSEDRLPKVAIWEPAVSGNDKVHEFNRKPILNDLKNKHKSVEVGFPLKDLIRVASTVFPVSLALLFVCELFP